MEQGLDLQLGTNCLTISPIDIDCAVGDVATVLPEIFPGQTTHLERRDGPRDFPILAIDQHLTGVMKFKVML